MKYLLSKSWILLLVVFVACTSEEKTPDENETIEDPITQRSYSLGAYLQRQLPHYKIGEIIDADSLIEAALEGIQRGMQGEEVVLAAATAYDSTKREISRYVKVREPLKHPELPYIKATYIKLTEQKAAVEFGRLAGANKTEASDFDIELIRAGLKGHAMDSVDWATSPSKQNSILKDYFESKRQPIRVKRADKIGKELLIASNEIQYLKLEEGTGEQIGEHTGATIIYEEYLKDGSLLNGSDGLEQFHMLSKVPAIWMTLLKEMQHGERCIFFIPASHYEGLDNVSADETIILDLKLISSSTYEGPFGD